MSVNPGARGNEVSPLPDQMALGIVNVIQAWQMTEIYDMSGKHLPVTISLSAGGAVRRSSLRCAPCFFAKLWKVKKMPFGK